MEFGRGPKARTEGYSISGSQARSVALNSGGTLRGGNRFSVSGPVVPDAWATARRAPSRAVEMQSNAFMPADGLAPAMKPEPQGGFNLAYTGHFPQSLVYEKNATALPPFPGFSSHVRRRALLAWPESFKGAEQRK